MALTSYARMVDIAFAKSAYFRGGKSIASVTLFHKAHRDGVSKLHPGLGELVVLIDRLALGTTF